MFLVLAVLVAMVNVNEKGIVFEELDQSGIELTFTAKEVHKVLKLSKKYMLGVRFSPAMLF